MVFLAEETMPVPTQDILSWIFDDVPYDQDKPVSDETFETISTLGRGLSTYKDLHRRHQARTIDIRQPSASDSPETHRRLTKMGCETWPEGCCLLARVQRYHVFNDVSGHHWRWRHLRWQ